MKNILLILLIIATIASISSCKKDEPQDPCAAGSGIATDLPIAIADGGTFDATAAALYPLAPVGQKVTLPGFVVATSQDSILSAHCTGATRSNVTKIVTDRLEVRIDVPATQTTGFIDSIWVSIDSVNGSNPTLVAHKYNWPDTERKLTLDLVPNTEIQGFFNADSIQVIIEATKRGPMGQYTIDPATRLEFESDFTMSVQL